ncbi:hypothetical protein FB451DRAFT_1280277 [Mycena latifolia]|nr:hypothetical protein FB451DRAFT_1280277 [Mycena latifolia]
MHLRTLASLAVACFATSIAAAPAMTNVQLSIAFDPRKTCGHPCDSGSSCGGACAFCDPYLAMCLASPYPHT